MKKNVLFIFLVPVAVSVVFLLLNFFPFYQLLENRIYDILLHVKPEIKEEESILFLDVDDYSIEKVGLWPWPRYIMADGLILMKEMNAKYAVFDIEYVDESEEGVNNDVFENDIPDSFKKSFDGINEYIIEFFYALVNGQIPMEEAEDYIIELSNFNMEAKDFLLQEINKIKRDNDLYLAQAAHFFGKAFFTLHMIENLENEFDGDKKEIIIDEVLENVFKKVPIKNVTMESDIPRDIIDIRPALPRIIEKSAGAGFVNVEIDDDGYLRRNDLVFAYEKKIFPQLSFSPLLDLLGSPEVIYKEDAIVLKGAQHPDGNIKDIKIPLTDDKRMLINWPKKKWLDSFRHLSYYQFVNHNKIEKNLLYNLMHKAIADSYHDYFEGHKDFYNRYDEAENIKDQILNGDSTDRIGEYRRKRAFFFEQLDLFLNGKTEETMLDLIDQILATPHITETEKTKHLDLREDVKTTFNELRADYKDLMEIRKILKKELEGSICFIGWTGTSTTDLGVTAFEKDYMNVGVHASIMNTILQGKFLNILPRWIGILIGVFASFLVTFVSRNLKPIFSIFIGFGFVFIIIICITVFFIMTGLYINMFTPAMACFFTFIIRTFIVFLITAKEKNFIRGAFSQYLSNDVINDLLSSPDKLKLGGEEKHMTAVFTDVKGFSTISEALTPTELVNLLNAYLTEMSNIILAQKGTIDKYEGDAIISFFGAPIELEDHARRACLSAARMKRMEPILNEHFLKEELAPSPLYTRIGINTGRMVVGNMGTPQKMDYTIMGDTVNLAARLEGVNKQYGSWILVSEYTYKEAGDGIMFRYFDRVRVVGKKTPVRLYEIIDEQEFVSDEVKKGIKIFHKALVFFEKKEWKKAISGFNEVFKQIPGDRPSEIFIERCEKYLKEPPSPDWDGVYNLTSK